MGGSFTISDDAHNASQVGTHFERILSIMEQLSIKRVVVWQGGIKDSARDLPDSRFKPISLVELKKHPFFA